MHPRGHELVHIRSMNWVQSTFITCHAFLFFARTSLDILGHMTVSSTTLQPWHQPNAQWSLVLQRRMSFDNDEDEMIESLLEVSQK